MVWIVHVFDSDIQTIASRAQRKRFPVKSFVIEGLGKQLGWFLHLYSVLKTLHDAVCNGGNTANNMDFAGSHAILGIKGDIAVFDLERNWHQHRISGDLY